MCGDRDACARVTQVKQVKGNSGIQMTFIRNGHYITLLSSDGHLLSDAILSCHPKSSAPQKTPASSEPSARPKRNPEPDDATAASTSPPPKRRATGGATRQSTSTEPQAPDRVQAHGYGTRTTNERHPGRKAGDLRRSGEERTETAEANRSARNEKTQKKVALANEKEGCRTTLGRDEGAESARDAEGKPSRRGGKQEG